MFNGTPPNMIAQVGMTLSVMFLFLLGMARLANPTKMDFRVANRVVSTANVLLYAFVALVGLLVLLALSTALMLVVH